LRNPRIQHGSDELNKNCVKRDYDKKLIQKCPGFEIEKVVDNTKSWLDADINRLNLLNGRETNYETNDDRLIINSKELILDVNISRAIETDLFNYIKKNDCLLDPCSYNTGLTICNKIKSSICITSGGTTEPIEEPTCENNNLITNGDFDTDLSGWDVFNFIWLSGEAVYSGSDEGGYLIQSVFEEGKTYKISFNLYMEGVEREPTASDVFVRYGNDIIKSYNHNGWLLIEEELTITAGNDLGFVFSDDGGLGFVYALDDVCVVEVIDNEPTSGSTSGTTCGDTGEDIKLFLSKLLNDVITVKEFNSLIYTDLIDVKSRKTISMYPVLKLLYERYLDSDLYCDVVSSKFSYLSMIDFTKLVGNYWVDLIEQVVPATSMWGSVYVYSNTVFDSQKFIYKKHRLFTCSKPNIDVIGVEGESQTDVVKITIDNNSEENQNCIVDDDNRETCNGVYQLQGTDGSEFIGTYKIIGSEEEDDVDFDSEEELVVIEEDNEEKPTAPPSDSTPPLSRPPDEWNPERS